MKKELLKTFKKNDVLENLFKLRERELEVSTPEKEMVIKENDLKSITHVDLNNEIKLLTSITNDEKDRLITDLDIVLENRELIHAYECKKYYIAGINDVLNIIFNEDSKVKK